MTTSTLSGSSAISLSVSPTGHIEITFDGPGKPAVKRFTEKQFRTLAEYVSAPERAACFSDFLSEVTQTIEDSKLVYEHTILELCAKHINVQTQKIKDGTWKAPATGPYSYGLRRYCERLYFEKQRPSAKKVAAAVDRNSDEYKDKLKAAMERIAATK